MPVSLTSVAAFAISRGSSDLGGWWAVFLGMAAMVAIASVHASQRIRMTTYWLGVLPLLLLVVRSQFLASGETTTDPDGCGNAAIGLCAMPFVLGAVVCVLGGFSDWVRVRLRVRGRAYPFLAGCAAICAVFVLASSLLDGRLPQRTAAPSRLIAGPVRATDDTGHVELGGMPFFYQEVHGVHRWDLHPMLGPEDGVVLGPSIELASTEGRTFARGRGEVDMLRWAAVDTGELRRVEQRDLPATPRAPGTFSLALLLAAFASLALVLRRGWLARQRRRVLAGLEGRVDAEGVATIGAHRIVLAPAPPPGPVVVFETAAADGSYRAPPTAMASGFVSGTRHGRALHLLGSMHRTWAYVALLLALGTLPALVALAHGRVMSSLF